MLWFTVILKGQWSAKIERIFEDPKFRTFSRFPECLAVSKDVYDLL